MKLAENNDMHNISDEFENGSDGWCQQFALKTYSSYTPGPIDFTLCRKHRGDL